MGFSIGEKFRNSINLVNLTLSPLNLLYISPRSLSVCKFYNRALDF
jgi:hypothetical protein